MKIIYISGPFLGNATRQNAEETIKINIEEAKKYAKNLASKGMGFFLPHIHSVDMPGVDLEEKQKFYYEQDTEFLIRASDAVIAIPGWETSFGARHEIKIARELGLPIFYPKSPDDLAEIETWYKENNEVEDQTGSRNKAGNWNNVLKIRSAMSKLSLTA